MVLWALTYFLLPDLGALRAFPNALYFSYITFTTLGYGDITIVSRWRLLSGVEAMNGILLFGWSTAMLFGLIQHLWQIRHLSREEKGRWTANPVQTTAVFGVKKGVSREGVDGGAPFMMAPGIGTILI
ncbi:MAG: potassium channel family protein [Candidatus Deferrimicrobiaceae bacterium]